MSAFDTKKFYISVLDTLHEQIALVDIDLEVQWVNRAWKQFYYENCEGLQKKWRGGNYLSVCKSALMSGDQDGANAIAGIESVINGTEVEFYYEYPCHSPTEQRWFLMHFRKLEWDGPSYFVSSHQNITKRKLAEIQLQKYSILDGLTGIPNRRHFDNFLDEQWRRSQRLGLPISLLLLDIDLFKNFNDNYGHVAGDECLKQIGQALTVFTRRLDDLAARYGGEEFCIILGNTDTEDAQNIAENVRAAIQALSIPHEYGTEAKCITVSVGVATMYPKAGDDTSSVSLVKIADKAVYAAKQAGRNRIYISETVQKIE